MDHTAQVAVSPCTWATAKCYAEDDPDTIIVNLTVKLPSPQARVLLASLNDALDASDAKHRAKPEVAPCP